MLHQETVEAGTLALIKRLSSDPKLKDFALVGGTALSGIRMATLDDIAAMKIHAVVNNGTRLKDYVDVHHLLEKKNLGEIIASYLARYPNGNAAIAKNALTYHKEIDFQKGLTLMNREIAWKDIAQRLRESVAEPKRVFQAKEAVRSQENKTEGPKLSKGLRKGKTP
jgi:Nucleotidyl transferase AbiEii toxin, Type IV TA system